LPDLFLSICLSHCVCLCLTLISSHDLCQ
jgi:hypothetical protein